MNAISTHPSPSPTVRASPPGSRSRILYRVPTYLSVHHLQSTPPVHACIAANHHPLLFNIPISSSSVRMDTYEYTTE
ncbi:hypothetical protein LX32DRAFT_336984 [Colletotrichum zoysiae]|uniref:Uncharacterized protein n=1 Tax=Colletotrichum zoysiae TaxID=1216348 RepID=A0AAD9HLD7_9PEZI|nr:hypothetical protein LX32DRAFT_336984 [Colletotrichum zoysiae]